MNLDQKIKKEYEFAMSHLDRTWLEMMSEYQESYQQFPSHWTRDECYWFARALAAVRQQNALENERMVG